MEWMYEHSAIRHQSQFNVLWVGNEKSLFDSVDSKIDFSDFDVKFSNYLDLEGSDFRRFQIIVFDLDSSDHENFVKIFEASRSSNPQPTLVAYSKTWSGESIGDYKNSFGVFGLSSSVETLVFDIETAIGDYKKRYQHAGALKKIRNQNSRLELLTRNLEKIVLDRTRQDEHSNTLAQQNVKNTQDLLRFIKQVARMETLEDILSVVRGEYKKIHGLMPPLLLFPEGGSMLRVYYFQGKQFVERMIAVDDLSLIDTDKEPSERELQVFLSDLFARPFGQVDSVRFQWNVKRLPSSQGLLVFEHSLKDTALEEFRHFSKERIPVLHLAVENILLRESSMRMARQWANTFNKIQDPIIIIDAEYRVTLANSQVPSTKTGICYRDFAKRDSPCIGCPVSESMASALPRSSDIHSQGDTYRVHSFPIFLDGQDKVNHVIHQYVNMTDTRNLQGRVIQGEKMAAVGMLAGNVAHELNNPLTGIYALSDLLLSDLDPDSNTFKDLVEVKDAAKRCQAIIKDLLEFSDLEPQKQQTVDLNTVIQKTLPLLKMALRNHNCKVSLVESPLWAKVQPQLFQQVIFNIIHNGCQAMDEGGDLFVESLRAKGFAEIRIRDTGAGIPEKLREVIFDPFFTTKEAGKGTGLGLSMSRSVIENFRGKLILSSSSASGSEFLIRIPLAEGEE